MYTHIHNTYIHTHIYIPTCTYIYTYMYTHTHMHTHICIPTHVHTYIHTRDHALKTEPRGTESLTALHFHITYIYKLRHVSLRVGNGLLKLLEIGEFEGTETRGNRNLKFPVTLFTRYLPYISQRYPLYWTVLLIPEQSNSVYASLHTSLTHSRYGWILWLILMTYCTVYAATILAVRESCSCRWPPCAISAIARQELNDSIK